MKNLTADQRNDAAMFLRQYSTLIGAIHLVVPAMFGPDYEETQRECEQLASALEVIVDKDPGS